VARQVMMNASSGERPENASPAVTVVIPVYNGEKYLRECLESVMTQTWRDFEIVCVDDGSTDGSAAICREFEVRLIQQANTGQSAARNRGVEVAKGKYIAFLDQDDKWYPERLAKGVAVLDRSEKYGMVYSNLDQIDENGNITILNLFDGTGWHPKRSLDQCLQRDMFILPTSVLIRRSLFVEIGGFDTDLIGYEDDDLFLRAFLRTRMFYVVDALAQWRIYRTSTSFTSIMLRSRYRYMRKLLARYPDTPESGDYRTRDCVAPRFFQLYLQDYIKAIQTGVAVIPPEDLRVQMCYLYPMLGRPGWQTNLVTHVPFRRARRLHKLWTRAPLPTYLRRLSV
jgi:glycosyltransferase involved in cell wall biosynthesis